MKKIPITILIILFFFISCKRGIETNSDLKKAKSEVFLRDEIDSYLHLTNYYYQKEDSYELLPYSLKMIKSGEKIGYSDYFESYLRISFKGEYDINDIIKLDKPEQDYLLYILNQGSSNRDDICKEILIEYYKNGIVVNKNLFKSDSIYNSLGHFENNR